MDERSATVRLAETRANAAALAQQPNDTSQALARMFESRIPELEREAASEPPLPENSSVPSLIETMHPGAVPRFSEADQQLFADRIQLSADELAGGTTE